MAAATTVLIITSEHPLDRVAARAWEIVEVPSVSEAVALLSRHHPYAAVVADLRGVSDPAAALAALAGARDVAVIAILDDPGPHAASAARSSIRLLDGAWVATDTTALWTYLGRDIAVAANRTELQGLRERLEQLVHNEKFTAVGLLAAEIAHEINNPAAFVITNLTVMIDYVNTIGRFHEDLRARLTNGTLDLAAFEEAETTHEIGFLGEDLDALLDRSLNGLNRIHQIVRDLRYFGTDQRRDSGWVDLDSLIRAAVNLARHEARFRAKLIVDLPPLPTVRSDANRLSQVVLNLLVNAVQAIDAGAPDDNRVTVSARSEASTVIISVSDTGSGIASDELESIFEPFFTTKAPGEGTGLGLAISRDIMASLGGEIRAESEVGVGSRFDIVIPRGIDD